MSSVRSASRGARARPALELAGAGLRRALRPRARGRALERGPPLERAGTILAAIVTVARRDPGARFRSRSDEPRSRGRARPRPRGLPAPPDPPRRRGLAELLEHGQEAPELPVAWLLIHRASGDPAVDDRETLAAELEAFATGSRDPDARRRLRFGACSRARGSGSDRGGWLRLAEPWCARRTSRWPTSPRSRRARWKAISELSPRSSPQRPARARSRLAGAHAVMALGVVRERTGARTSPTSWAGPASGSCTRPRRSPREAAYLEGSDADGPAPAHGSRVVAGRSGVYQSRLNPEMQVRPTRIGT